MRLSGYSGLSNQSWVHTVLVARALSISAQNGNATFHLKGHLNSIARNSDPPEVTCLARPEFCPKSVLAFSVSLEVLEKVTALQISFVPV